MQIIEKLAKFIADVFFDRNNPQSLQDFLELIILFTLLTLAYFSKQLLLLVPLIRNQLAYGEKYAGQHVQIIGNGDNRRYSLLDIRYKPLLEGYFLKGIQYDFEGHRAIDFESDKVTFQDGPIVYLVFLWRAETLADKKRFDGYTQMRPDDPGDTSHMAGRGFFITFDQQPRRFDLRFIKLTKPRLNRLGLRLPKNEEERVKFITALHAKLQQHPSLQPLDECGRALL